MPWGTSIATIQPEGVAAIATRDASVAPRHAVWLSTLRVDESTATWTPPAGLVPAAVIHASAICVELAARASAVAPAASTPALAQARIFESVPHCVHPETSKPQPTLQRSVPPEKPSDVHVAPPRSVPSQLSATGVQHVPPESNPPGPGPPQGPHTGQESIWPLPQRAAPHVPTGAAGAGQATTPASSVVTSGVPTSPTTTSRTVESATRASTTNASPPESRGPSP